MATNVDIRPNKNENHVQLLRRFTSAYREAGLMHTVKKRRYYARDKAELAEKNGKLRRIKDAIAYKVQRRLGKIS